MVQTILLFWVVHGRGHGHRGGCWITVCLLRNTKAGLRIRAQLDMEGHIIEAQTNRGGGDGRYMTVRQFIGRKTMGISSLTICFPWLL